MRDADKLRAALREWAKAASERGFSDEDIIDGLVEAGCERLATTRGWWVTAERLRDFADHMERGAERTKCK